MAETNTLMQHAPNLQRRLFARIAAHIVGVTAHPVTFALSCVVVNIWAISSLIFHFADSWQTMIGTSMAMGTFLMVFLVQNTQNRNSVALQAKLDELIRAIGPANNKLIGLEHHTIEHVHELRLERDHSVAPHGPNETDKHGPAMKPPLSDPPC